MSADGAARYVIAAGTENYSDPEAARLPSVPQEVQTLVAFLTTQHGYQVQLPELAHDPTSKELCDVVVDWLTDDQRNRTDVAVIYYSGHGGTLGNFHYLLTRDTKSGKFASTAVPSDFFVKALGETPRTRRLLLILDTCNSGQGAFNAREVATQLSSVQNLTGEYEGIWVVTASRPREEADQSVFVEAFTQAALDVQSDTGAFQP